MGREVRRVPADWTGKDIGPHFDQSYKEAAEEWKREQWEKGLRWSYLDDDWIKHNSEGEYWDWAGTPNPDYYRPHWEESARTHYMMYETTSEGSPISPAFETPEELAQWLADTDASSFGRMTATYEQWLNVCKGGWAPSAVISDNYMMSGVEASEILNKD